ncbi:MAG TPA: hypothetical protein VFB82_20710 [Blastocatellia bacterium]|nr:hypothetical protein [Blastocatellia bacterium]
MNYLVRGSAQTPVAFRAGRDIDREATLGYVPGSVILGGLAASHAQMRPHRRDEFAEFFLRERVIFGNLYPAKFSKSVPALHPLDQEASPVRPLPRTARSCKRFGGFKFHADSDADERHGVWDSLVIWAAFALCGERNPAVFGALRECSCGEPFDSFSGFCRRGSDAGQWGAATASSGIVTRTGISRATGAVAMGVLYSREFLHAGNDFYGEWSIADELASDFNTFLADVSDGSVRVGHNRTRGFGKLAFTEGVRATSIDSAADIQARCIGFDAALRQAAGDDAHHAFYMAVTLAADCILSDRAGRYRLQMTADTLAEAWGISGAELIYCNAVPRRVTGWNDRWGLPKADEWAIGMGSVFLFGLVSEPDWQALARAQEQGCGTHRSGGFGAVRISDQFHVEVHGA